MIWDLVDKPLQYRCEGRIFGQPQSYRCRLSQAQIGVASEFCNDKAALNASGIGAHRRRGVGIGRDHRAGTSFLIGSILVRLLRHAGKKAFRRRNDTQRECFGRDASGIDRRVILDCNAENFLTAPCDFAKRGNTLNTGPGVSTPRRALRCRSAHKAVLRTC